MPIFLPQEKGRSLSLDHALWATPSFLVLPPGGESDHHYLIFGRGLLFEKESSKPYSKGLRGGIFLQF